MFQHHAAGDFAAAAAVAGEAVRIAERFGDRDLLALAIHGQGHMLIGNGQVRDGLALLDEAMVAVTAEEPSPIVTGIVYCGVILACQEVLRGAARTRVDAGPLGLVGASAWRWLLSPGGASSTGRRSSSSTASGADALDEARRAGERFAATRNPAAGLACYRQGELLRLQGDFAGSERAYREASGFGWEPQPGLAQLRLAQGRTDAAVSAITRAEAEIDERGRARATPARFRGDRARGRGHRVRASCV